MPKDEKYSEIYNYPPQPMFYGQPVYGQPVYWQGAFPLKQKEICLEKH